MKAIDPEDFDQLLTRMEIVMYACEEKTIKPSTVYLQGVNKQVKREIAFIKELQRKYQRTPGTKRTARR
jgi:hypothetical protein